MPHVDIQTKYVPFTEYPHMRAADVQIWNRFIAANPARFLHTFYDFRVGEPADSHKDCGKCANVAWYDLTRWQIDIVAEDNEKIYIIEIKPGANAKALGQALAYSILFTLEQKPPKPVIPVVITDHIIETTRKVAELQGVELWEA